jgi:hypothetical protein
MARLTLTSDQVSLMEDFCDQNGYEFREDYSGRGMYGKSCIGFVTEESAFRFGISLGEYLTDQGEECLFRSFVDASVKEDSMGLDTIIYFPYINSENVLS